MANKGTMTADDTIHGVLLREIVEEHYPEGWDEFVVNMVQGVEDLAEYEIEMWNDIGDVPSGRWQTIDAILGFPEGRIDYELLRPADSSAAEAAKEAKARAMDGDNTNEDVWDSFDASMEDDAEEGEQDGGEDERAAEEETLPPEQDSEEPGTPEISEGFEDASETEIPPESEQPEPEEEEEEDDIDLGDIGAMGGIELDDSEPDPEPEDVASYFMQSPEDAHESLPEETADMPAQETRIGIPEDSQELIGRTVSYANIIFNCSDELLVFLSYLIGVNGKPKEIREDTADMVIEMMNSDIAFFQDTAKQFAKMKRRGSVNLGVYVGSLNQHTFRALKQIASSVYTGDHVGKKTEVDAIDRHTLAETLDVLPDTCMELIDAFVALEAI